MILKTFKQALADQFAGSFSMLGHCVAKCPDALWNEPVVRFPFYQVAFHTLIFADLYLSLDEASFRQQPFHHANVALFRDYEQLEDRDPVLFYDRSQLLTYLEFCRGKASVGIAAETAESLSVLCRFPSKTVSRAELHINNIRHIQHHTGQLTMRLRLDSNVDIPWITSGWQGPDFVGHAL